MFLFYICLLVELNAGHKLTQFMFVCTQFHKRNETMENEKGRKEREKNKKATFNDCSIIIINIFCLNWLIKCSTCRGQLFI